MAIEWFKMKETKWWHGQAFFHKQEAKEPKGKGSRSPSTWHNFQHQTRTTHECHTQFHHDHYKSNIEKQITWGWQLLHLGCHSSPLPTQDLVPRSKHGKARDTQNGDDLHAPTSPPSPSDVPTAP